jgi:cytochrome c-type biogenesis protein CcmH/NrfG
VAVASPAPPFVIQPLGADGSIPFDESHAPRRLSDRALVAVIAAALLVLAIAGGVFLLVRGHDAARTATTATTSATDGTATPSTTQDGRDLSQVTNAEMEAIVAANPDVVPMRLALVERYLHAADGEQDVNARRTQLEHARAQASEAAARATVTADQAKALRYLGWTTALLTDPAAGASLLEQSLAKEPGNPDALWFLATVRFDQQKDAAAAKPLLEQLLQTPIDATQRTAVQAKLDKVNAALATK